MPKTTALKRSIAFKLEVALSTTIKYFIVVKTCITTTNISARADRTANR
jgi:hypothetical protein